MSVFAEIASRYGIDAADEEAVDRFFDENAAQLKPEEREEILTELLTREGSGESPRRIRYATGSTTLRAARRKTVQVPPNAVDPARDSQELQRIGEALRDCVAAFLTLAGLDIIVDASVDEQGRIELRLRGTEAERLQTERAEIVRSITRVSTVVVNAQPLVDKVDLWIGTPDSPHGRIIVSTKSQVKVSSTTRLPISVRRADHINVETMSVDDAAHKLAASEQQFLTFRNVNNGAVCVLYRPNDARAPFQLIETPTGA